MSKIEEVRGASVSDGLSDIPNKTAQGKLNRILNSMNNSVVAEKIVNPEPNTSTCCTKKKLEAHAELVGSGSDKCTGNMSKVVGDTHAKISVNVLIANYKLPSNKIDTFGGEVTEFPSWQIAFDVLVDQNVTSIHLKLNLISQHLCGAAESLVLGLLSNHNEQVYLSARARLQQHYGNSNILRLLVCSCQATTTLWKFQHFKTRVFG